MKQELEAMHLTALRKTTELWEQATKMAKPKFFGRRWSAPEIEEWLKEPLFQIWRVYVITATTEHTDTLLRKRRNLLVRGDYDEVDLAPWTKEAWHFLSDVCFVPDSVLERIGDALHGQMYSLLDKMEALGVAVPQATQVSLDVTSMTPEQYEELCADHMRTCGYAVRLTKASGDQGVDVIATKGNVTVVIQCKLHSSPVGNKAVQEVYAGKKFIGADIAAVVSNNEFTPAAKQLAHTVNVLLLHHSQLKTYFGQ